jgi:hypothetical protein
VARAAVLRRLTWQVATVEAVVDETPRVKTIVLEAPDWPGHRAGQHVDVRLTAEDGYQAAREYSIASAPGEPPAITVERLDDGEVSPYLTEELREGDAIELHRLLPHATRQLGTEVRLDGTVVDAATGPGFWVRDLRDNVVFVDNHGAAAPVEPGDPVRVLGSVALLPLEDHGASWQAVQQAVPPTALLVRDVKVTPADGGIEILRED